MSKIGIYSYRLVLGFKAILLYKNWLSVLLSYVGLKHEPIYRLRNGIRYAIRPHSKDFQIVNDIYMNKIYHRYLPLLRKNSTVIDIGANVGVFSVLAAKQNKDVRVYAFEPFESNFKMLQKNTILNKLQNHIYAFQTGVASQKGTRSLYIDKDNTGAHTLFGKGSKVTIPVISLADIFKKNNLKVCDFLKMDCEGAEFEILYKTPRSILSKIKTITLEFHELSGAGTAKELKLFLQKMGFKCSVVGSKLGFIYAQREDPKQRI